MSYFNCAKPNSLYKTKPVWSLCIMENCYTVYLSCWVIKVEQKMINVYFRLPKCFGDTDELQVSQPSGWTLKPSRNDFCGRLLQTLSIGAIALGEWAFLPICSIEPPVMAITSVSTICPNVLPRLSGLFRPEQISLWDGFGHLVPLIRVICMVHHNITRDANGYLPWQSLPTKFVSPLFKLGNSNVLMLLCELLNVSLCIIK